MGAVLAAPPRTVGPLLSDRDASHVSCRRPCRAGGSRAGAEASVRRGRATCAPAFGRLLARHTFSSAGAQLLHVRRAPATSDAAQPAVLVHGLGGSAGSISVVIGLPQLRPVTLHLTCPRLRLVAPALGRRLLVGRASAQVNLSGRESDVTFNGRGARLPDRQLTRRRRRDIVHFDLVRTLARWCRRRSPCCDRESTNAHLPALAAPWIGQPTRPAVVGQVPGRGGGSRRRWRSVLAEPFRVPRQFISRKVPPRPTAGLDWVTSQTRCCCRCAACSSLPASRTGLSVGYRHPPAGTDTLGLRAQGQARQPACVHPAPPVAIHTLAW